MNGYNKLPYKITVDNDLCIMCRACIDTPCVVTGEYLFHLEDGNILVNDKACISANKVDAIKLSELCPMSAITVKEIDFNSNDYLKRFL